MNTSGSKTPTTFIPLHINYDYRSILLINTYFHVLSCGIPSITSKRFYHRAWFVNQYIFTFASQNKLHIYGFSGIVNLFNSSPGIALSLRWEVLGYKSCETQAYLSPLKTVVISTTNVLHIHAHLCWMSTKCASNVILLCSKMFCDHIENALHADSLDDL